MDKAIERHFTTLPSDETRDDKVSITKIHLCEIADFAEMDHASQEPYLSLPVEDSIEFTGEAGSVLLIDTSALFHCGSCTMEKPRLQAIAAYHPLISNLPYRVFKKIHLPESAYARTNENIMSDLQESIL